MTHAPAAARTPAVLLAVALLLALLATGCSRPPAPVDLAVLTDEQDAWDGRTVQVAGTLRSFDDPLHYWVEDDVPNRVELLPHDGLAELVGTRVVVEGRFTFREGEGRRITLGSVTPCPAVDAPAGC